MSEYIIEIPDEYFASYDTERDMYYPDERDSAMPLTPFVRCRDCKRVTIDQGDHDYREPLWCGLFHIDVSLDGFCAWGEVRAGSSEVRVEGDE